MTKVTTVNILGSEWDVFMCELSEDKWFEENEVDGRCQPCLKKIVFVDPRTDTRQEFENDVEMFDSTRLLLKHEVIHAFLFEAGLDSNSIEYDGAWPCNEEMIQFFAVQMDKMCEASNRVVSCAIKYLSGISVEPRYVERGQTKEGGCDCPVPAREVPHGFA